VDELSQELIDGTGMALKLRYMEDSGPAPMLIAAQ
jgi:hypothetical protein